MDNKSNLILKSYRVKMNLSQQIMANILNISKDSYSSKENNLVDFKSSEMIQISKYFNVTMQELFN